MNFIQKLTRKAQWILTILTGVTITIAYLQYFAQPDTVRLQDKIVLFIYFSIIFTILAHLLFTRYIVPQLRILSHNKQRILIGASIAISIAWVLVRTHPFSESHLIITATGQKNVAAQGSEVWVKGIFRPDGSQIPVAALQQQGTWDIRDGVPISHQDQPASLTWDSSDTSEIRLQFVSHPWSGNVTIVRNGQVQTVDLYADKATTKEVLVPYVTVTPSLSSRLLYKIGIFGVNVVSFGMLAFSLCYGLISGSGMYMRGSSSLDLLFGKSA